MGSSGETFSGANSEADGFVSFERLNDGNFPISLGPCGALGRTGPTSTEDCQGGNEFSTSGDFELVRVGFYGWFHVFGAGPASLALRCESTLISQTLAIGPVFWSLPRATDYREQRCQDLPCQEWRGAGRAVHNQSLRRQRRQRSKQRPELQGRARRARLGNLQPHEQYHAKRRDRPEW